MSIQHQSLPIVLFVLMVSLTTSTPSPWSSWNTPTYVNMTNYPQAPNPGVGFYYARYANANGVFASNRTYQYRWDLFANGNSTSKCAIYCGPRSFLTVDSANPSNIVCQRDQNTKYWGNPSLTNDNGEDLNYYKYCIPTTENCDGV